MRYVAFGTTDLRPSVIGVGCARIGSILGRTDRAQAERLIASAVERGVNFFDTADIYGQGESERMLGATLKAHRDRVIIASKAGKRLPAAARWAALAKGQI